MNATSAHALRRFWPALVSAILLAQLWIVHTLGFRPLAVRYRAQLATAGEIGASLDPSLALAPLPPRVIDLLRRNSVAAEDAEGLSQSGFLATDLVRRISETAGAFGIDVAASEPGVATQSTSSLEVRAHLRLRCHYDQFIRLLDALAAGRSFFRIERMSLTPRPDGLTDVELWVARLLFKRGAPR